MMPRKDQNFAVFDPLAFSCLAHRLVVNMLSAAFLALSLAAAAHAKCTGSTPAVSHSKSKGYLTYPVQPCGALGFVCGAQPALCV